MLIFYWFKRVSDHKSHVLSPLAGFRLLQFIVPLTQFAVVRVQEFFVLCGGDTHPTSIFLFVDFFMGYIHIYLLNFPKFYLNYWFPFFSTGFTFSLFFFFG